MRVLIIPEDPTHDQYIIKPVVERIFSELGRRAYVEVLRDPHLRGINEALDREVISSIITDNRMVDLFIVVADRDCNRLNAVEKGQAREADFPNQMLVCLAEQEVEVWALALHREQLRDAWPIVRGECDPKELYFDRLMQIQGWETLLGGGRKEAMRSLAGTSWQSFTTICSEVRDLQQRIQQQLRD